jgi:hypothetical protein
MEEIKGYYFKSDKDVATDYFIEVADGVIDGNKIARVYEIDSLPSIFNIGAEVIIRQDQITFMAVVNLWPKHFILTISREFQFYYDDKKYYGSTRPSDQVASLSEAINFAIEKGLKDGNIKPY